MQNNQAYATKSTRLQAKELQKMNPEVNFCVWWGHVASPFFFEWLYRPTRFSLTTLTCLINVVAHKKRLWNVLGRIFYFHARNYFIPDWKFSFYTRWTVILERNLQVQCTLHFARQKYSRSTALEETSLNARIQLQSIVFVLCFYLFVLEICGHW